MTRGKRSGTGWPGRILTFLRCERGATAIEYAVIAAAVTVAIVASVIAIGDEMVPHYTDVRDGLRDLQ